MSLHPIHPSRTALEAHPQCQLQVMYPLRLWGGGADIQQYIHQITHIRYARPLARFLSHLAGYTCGSGNCRPAKDRLFSTPDLLKSSVNDSGSPLPNLHQLVANGGRSACDDDVVSALPRVGFLRDGKANGRSCGSRRSNNRHGNAVGIRWG